MGEAVFVFYGGFFFHAWRWDKTLQGDELLWPLLHPGAGSAAGRGRSIALWVPVWALLLLTSATVWASVSSPVKQGVGLDQETDWVKGLCVMGQVAAPASFVPALDPGSHFPSWLVYGVEGRDRVHQWELALSAFS